LRFNGQFAEKISGRRLCHSYIIIAENSPQRRTFGFVGSESQNLGIQSELSTDQLEPGKAQQRQDVRWNAKSAVFVYRDERKKLEFRAQISRKEWRTEMSDAKDVMRIGTMILLGIFVLFVVAPILLKIVGITFAFLIHLAVGLIYMAVALAVGYLVLVGIRALLR